MKGVWTAKARKFKIPINAKEAINRIFVVSVGALPLIYCTKEAINETVYSGPKKAWIAIARYVEEYCIFEIEQATISIRAAMVKGSDIIVRL